jgi:hypothetical protein
MGVAEETTGMAQESAHRLKEAGSSSVSSVGDKMVGMADGTRHAAQGNPLAMGVLAFAAGLVASAAMPPTQRERELVQRAEPMLESVARETGPALTHAVQELKPVAEQSMAEVKDAARDAAAQVKDDASQAATEVKHDAQASREG